MEKPRANVHMRAHTYARAQLPRARGHAQAHQQVLHVPHGLVDVVQNFPAALSCQLHLLSFRRLFCGQGRDGVQ